MNASSRPAKQAGLYVHVPFCLSRCRYCNFTTGPLTDGEPERVYLPALERELRALPTDFSATSVYMGGGTPTALPEKLLRRLVTAVARAAGPTVTEWSCEANPETVTAARARLLREGGVNRVSLGVQSFDDGVLSRLGRAHDARGALRAWDRLRAAGIDNLNIDLLLAIPGCGPRRMENDLRRALELQPGHISCYALAIEPGSALHAEMKKGRLREVDGRTAADRYQRVRDILGAAGYEHYEISNWARPGRTCRHNLLYWTGADYEGCGPAAHGHRDGLRYANPADTGQWAATRGRRPRRAFEERLGFEARARERLVMGLRLTAGIDCEAFRKETGHDVFKLGGALMRRHLEEGWLEYRSGRLRLAAGGLFVSNAILADLV